MRSRPHSRRRRGRTRSKSCPPPARSNSRWRASSTPAELCGQAANTLVTQATANDSVCARCRDMRGSQPASPSLSDTRLVSIPRRAQDAAAPRCALPRRIACDRSTRTTCRPARLDEGARHEIADFGGVWCGMGARRRRAAGDPSPACPDATSSPRRDAGRRPRPMEQPRAVVRAGQLGSVEQRRSWLRRSSRSSSSPSYAGRPRRTLRCAMTWCSTNATGSSRSLRACANRHRSESRSSPGSRSSHGIGRVPSSRAAGRPPGSAARCAVARTPCAPSTDGDRRWGPDCMARRRLRTHHEPHGAAPPPRGAICIRQPRRIIVAYRPRSG